VASTGFPLAREEFGIHTWGMIRLLFSISLPLYLLDQWSKNWIVGRFPLYVEEMEVIPGVFWLHHAANTGVAFGLFNGTAYANYAFGAISLGALVMLTWFYKKGMFPGAFSRLAVALLVSGIFGNVTDRLVHGYVVDFLKFDFGFAPFNPWPSFNVADSCVVVASVLLVLASFLEKPVEGKVGE
jgi:signal peptidase II